MALFRMVRGRRVRVSAAEEAAQRADWAVNDISIAKRRLRNEFIDEATTRINAALPFAATFDQVQLLESIWPGLNVSSLSPSVVAANDVAAYVRTQALPAVIAMTDIASLRAIDPKSPAPFGTGGPDWP